MADLVEARQMGLAVAPGDVEALADALGRLLGDDDLRTRMGANAGATAAEMVWPTVLAPLLEFCRSPRRAPDLLDAGIAGHLRRDLAGVPGGWRGLRYDLRTGAGYLRDGGPGLVAAKVAGRVRRLVSSQGVDRT